MISSKKDTLQPDRQKVSSGSICNDIARYSDLFDGYAQDILLGLLKDLDEILGLLGVKTDHDLDDIRLGIAKELVFNALMLTQSDPLFRQERYRPLLKIFKDSLCAHLFTSIFQMHASGKNYEYFSCIFEKEYNQLSQELVDLISRRIEKDKKILNFERGKDILESWLPFFQHKSFDDETVGLVSGKMRDILISLQLKMAKALLS